MPLPLSGGDIVSQIKSSAIAAADFGLRNNGTKPNNVAGAIQYNSSKPTGFKRPSILTLQQKLNNLVFDAKKPTVYFNTINQLLSNQPIPTIVTTVLTPDLRVYFHDKGIDLIANTLILNLATTNQNGVQVFDIAQIEQINPGTNHYIYFSDNKPIKIGNTTIEIIKRINDSNALKVTPDTGYSTNYEFGDEITIEGEKFEFLGSGSGGLFIYKGRNYAIVNTTNTVTSEINDPINNNIDGIALDSAKNIYLADYGNNRVLKFSNEGTLIKIYESQLFDNPRGIAIDSANNIYVTNYNANTLVKITATTDIITKVLDNIEKPYGICYNDSTYQRFYITCDGSVKVAGPDPGSGIFGILNSYNIFDDTIVKGITVDSSGNNIYVVSENPNQVIKINTTTGNVTPYYSFFNIDNTAKPNGITIDSSNNLYLVLSGKNKIIKITSNINAVDFVNNNDLNNPQGIVFDSLSNNFYITNKIGINPVLTFSNTYTALTNNGFPTNGKIVWICKNNNYYNPNDFYVLVNVTDSSQNIDSVYSCSITSRGAVYTKIFDYSYGQYNIVLQKSNRKDIYLTRVDGAPEKINHTENFEPDDIYGNFIKLNVEVCSEYERRSSSEGYRCKGYDLHPNDINSSEQGARIKYISDGRNTYTEWKWKDSTDTYETRGIFVRVDKSYTRPLVREISLPHRFKTDRTRASPRCMVSDRQGNIYITNYGNSSNKDLPSVYKCNIKGNSNSIVSVYYGTYDDVFYGIELINNDRFLCISNTTKNKVIILDLSTKQVSLRLEEVSGNPTLLSSNKSNGDIFVYDQAKTKISKITRVPTGINIQDYLTRSNISAFAKTSDDNSMHFIDANKLYKVTPSGGISNEIRQYADIDFRRLTHCVLDSNNNLYVVDDNINIYNLNGKTVSSNIEIPKLSTNTNIKQGFVLNYKLGVVTTILNEQPSPPIAVAVDNAGNIYYLDANSIRKVTPNGSILITTTITPSGGDGNDHLVIDSNGDLYFSRKSTIYKFIIKENRQFVLNAIYAEREDRNIVGMFIDRPNQVLYFNHLGGNVIYILRSINSISSLVNSVEGFISKDSTKIWYDTGRNLLSLVSGRNGILKRRFDSVEFVLPGSDGYSYGDFVVDSFNNVYCTEVSTSNIRKITPQGVNTVVVGNGRGYVDGSKNIAKFDSPSRIAIEPNNNLIVIDNGKIRRIYTNDTKIAITDSNSDSIIQYSDNTSKKFNSNIGIFDNPKAIVKDSNGNIFVLSIGDKTIYKINSIDNITYYATNLPSPNGGMAIDTNGIIYITNLDNTISKINSNGTVEIFITSVQFLKNPIDLIIDSTNSNMYILNRLGSISKIVMSTRVISELVDNLPSKISGLAIDSSNNLYFLNQSDNAIAKVVTDDGTLTSSFISGIINATDIFHENGELYVLTIDRKYYFINLSKTPPTSTLSIINNEIYNPSIPIATSTSITQPVKIPDGTEYINFVLIGGGGSGGYGDDFGGGSGAQLKFRIRVGINNLNYFKFEVGKGGDPGYGIINKDGGDTKVNFFSDEKGTQYSIPKLKDLFIAGGGKSQINGGSGGIVSRFLSEFKFNLNLSNDTPVNAVVSDDFQVLEPTQRTESTINTNDLINIRGSLYGINGSKGDPLFNIFGLGGDLNSNIYTSYTTTTDQINIGTPTNTLNGNFKKVSSTSSSKNFDLSLYSPGKGGDSTRGDRRAMPGNDGLVAWFFEGPSQYTDVTLDPIFKVPRSLMNQKFDNKWFTLLFKTESAIISTVDQNNSDNNTATFLCDTDGNVTLVNPGSGYIPQVSGGSTGEVKIKRSENSIFPDDGDIMIIVKSVGDNGKILTWSLTNEVLGQSLYDITIPEGVTQVDCAMIGAGGNSGPYIREPLFVPTTEITFSIEVKYRDYNIITHGPGAWLFTNSIPAAGEFTNKEIMSFYDITIWNRTYTLTELCNEINNQIDEQRYKNVGNLRFTILTKENYTSGGIGPYAHYGFITDEMEMLDFTTGEAIGDTQIYTKRVIREYTMKLSNVTNNSFLFRTNMNNTNGRECIIANALPFGARVSSLYFPSLLRQPINQVIPDHLALFGVNYVNKHPTHILPSFDGGDGSNGQYQRKIINVVSGDTLKIKIGGYQAGIGPYITRTPLTNNLFSVLRNNGLLNGFNGNSTEIIHKRNSNNLNTFISSGGKGGLSNDQNRLESNDQTIINKPDLPSGSFTYPIVVPPGWQDGYGKGGTTNRTFDTYDNPGVRGSHGCVMIKFN